MSRSERARDASTVLVVDDSVFMRRMISDMVDRFPGFRVVGVAADGEEALRRIDELDPDVVTLDIEMPRLDGFGVLERVMSARPRPIVVLSAYTEAGSDAALRALELGAVDFVAKPSGPVSFDVARVEGRLYETLQAACAADPTALLRERAAGVVEPPKRPPAEGSERVVAIAASTGGPRALAHLLGSLPVELGAAALVVPASVAANASGGGRRCVDRRAAGAGLSAGRAARGSGSGGAGGPAHAGRVHHDVGGPAQAGVGFARGRGQRWRGRGARSRLDRPRRFPHAGPPR